MEELDQDTQCTETRFTEAQLGKHLEEAPSFSSMEIEGSEATLVTVVSDNLLQTVNESSGSLTDKKVTPVSEDETSAIVVVSDDVKDHDNQCKIFTLPDSDSN